MVSAMSSFTLQYASQSASQVSVKTVVAKYEKLFLSVSKILKNMESIQLNLCMKIVDNYYHNLNSKARGAPVTLSTCIALRKKKSP